VHSIGLPRGVGNNYPWRAGEAELSTACSVAVATELEQYFSALAHDLRTPVAAIKASIGVVLANEPPDLPPTLHRMLGNIDLAADELTRLIDERLKRPRY
jgi:signal transduction histidine kinase